MHFSAANGRLGAVQALVEGGASLGVTTSKGETPLDLARMYGKAKKDMAVASYLKKQGATAGNRSACTLS